MEIDAFFSPGNTGAIVVASALIMGRVKGIRKPALCTFVPNTKNETTLLIIKKEQFCLWCQKVLSQELSIVDEPQYDNGAKLFN